MSDEILDYARALREHPQKVSRQVRGIMAKKLDAAATQVRDEFLASQGPRGRGMDGSAGTIRARMDAATGSRGGQQQAGYLLADGPGVYYWEHGHRHVPPAGAFRRAAKEVFPSMASEVREIMVRVRP